LTIGLIVHTVYSRSNVNVEEVSTMPLLEEKEIRGFHLREKGFVCPVCATDEERDAGEPVKMVAEDVVHNEESMFCIRCKKKIQ
jgi:hypothetical protein